MDELIIYLIFLWSFVLLVIFTAIGMILYTYIYNKDNLKRMKNIGEEVSNLNGRIINFGNAYFLWGENKAVAFIPSQHHTNAENYDDLSLEDKLKFLVDKEKFVSVERSFYIKRIFLFPKLFLVLTFIELLIWNAIEFDSYLILLEVFILSTLIFLVIFTRIYLKDVGYKMFVVKLGKELPRSAMRELKNKFPNVVFQRKDKKALRIKVSGDLDTYHTLSQIISFLKYYDIVNVY